ncbi:MAG: PD-(D/E)XK nuclease family protein [Motiliproteus sp.]
MTEVILGIDCEQDASPDMPAGGVVVGLKGMLSLLETQLGLAGTDVSLVRRQVQYHACLQEALTEARFYNQSFQADPFSTSRTLLQWRDELYLGGWTGRFLEPVSTRLTDLAAVEVLAGERVAVSEGQRLQRVLATLTEQRVQISSIRLIDAAECFPPLWQRLLTLLVEDHGVEVSVFTPKMGGANVTTDLAMLQQQLRRADTAHSKIDRQQFQNDGSVLFLEAESVHLSAKVLAQIIGQRHQQSPQPDYLILAEQSGVVLDAALDAKGLTRVGFYGDSPWRPVFQILPLAYELCWQPLNPLALLQFLSHPLGPLPPRLRSRLAKVVGEEPGIGGEAWKNCIDQFLTELAEENSEQAASVSAKIEFWLHGERFDPETGMPVSVAVQRCEKLLEWLSARLARLAIKMDETGCSAPDSHLFAAAVNQSKELIDTLVQLADSGIERIEREGMRQLIEEVRGTGIGLVDRCSQVALELPQLFKAETPAPVIRSHDVVIWWDCRSSRSLRRRPWFTGEREALAGNGVVLWDENTQLQQQADSWLRPLLAADKQLIIVQHADATQHHPVLDLLEAMTEGITPLSAEQVLLQNTPICIAGKTLKLSDHEIAQQPLPAKFRWWQLPDDIELPKRDMESYSSLEQFINSPYQWVMNYPARLRSGALVQLNDQNRLKGSLAHRLFELFFIEHSDPSVVVLNTIRTWVRDRMPELLNTQGAVLLMPGRLAECERFIEQTIYALERLTEQLYAADITHVEMEQAQDGAFNGGDLGGSIDLLATNRDGVEGVIDIKWGGYRYRREGMEEGSYLQLATYAKLRRDSAGRWPALAFYLITDARLLTFDGGFFPKGERVERNPEASTAEYWQRIEHTWQWRREQIDGGRVEVTVGGTEAGNDSQPGEYGVVVPETNDRFSDFAVLTGWREQE